MRRESRPARPPRRMRDPCHSFRRFSHRVQTRSRRSRRVRRLRRTAPDRFPSADPSRRIGKRYRRMVTMNTPGLIAFVLAAGQGTRMKSRLPKILHPAAGRPLFHYSVRAAVDAGAERVVVVTSPDCLEAIRTYSQTAFADGAVTAVVQNPPRGT